MSPRPRLTLRFDYHRPGPRAGATGLDGLGFLAPLCLAAPTAEEALRVSCELAPLWCTMSPTLRRDRDLLLVRATVPDEGELAGDGKFEPLALIGLWLSLVEHVAQHHVYPQAVYLPQLGEGDKDALRATFACVVYFDQPILGAAFRAVDVQGPNTAADPRLFRLLREYAEERLADQVEQRSTSERLIQALRNLEDVSDASAEHLACLLGLGVRTLHRRLQAEGSSYRQIFEEFRRQRCLAQLSVSSSSAKRIAFSLGFANPASFHRAFRRWTGQTVSAFRGRTPEEPCLARKQDAS